MSTEQTAILPPEGALVEIEGEDGRHVVTKRTWRQDAPGWHPAHKTYFVHTRPEGKPDAPEQRHDLKTITIIEDETP